jgi:transposase
MQQGIILSVDYHDRVCVIRWLDPRTRKEMIFTEVPTSAEALSDFVDQARRAAGRRRVVWIQESTTGWARVKDLLGDRVEFQLANVVQMPQPPKARRHKTDKTDTARIQREYLNGRLPLAYQPPAWWRRVRRLVSFRENLVARRTALRNWINRYLAHETWFDRTGLWTTTGQKQLQALLKQLPAQDTFIITQKLEELKQLKEQLGATIKQLLAVFQECPEAQRLDAIPGINVVSAVSIVARIGPVKRFSSVDCLIAYAGLAPGIHESDQTRRDGHIGGGGTDRHLRHYLIEATTWAQKAPRYAAAYGRVRRRKGSKVARLVVARMLLRSIYKMIKEGVEFEAEPTAAVAAAGS